MLTNALLSSLLCACRGINPSVFYLTLSILFARISNNPNEIDEAWRQVPKDKQREVDRKVKAILNYFNDPRYSALMEGPAIWGLIINVIKVACKLESVPARQQELCEFESSEVVEFLNNLLDRWTLRQEVYSACNIGSSDWQLLRVLMTADHLTLESMTIIVKFFSAEGPSGLKALPPEVANAVHLSRFGDHGGTFKSSHIDT